MPFVIKLSPSNNKFKLNKSRCDNFLTIDFEKNTDNHKLCAFRFSAMALSAFSSQSNRWKRKVNRVN